VAGQGGFFDEYRSARKIHSVPQGGWSAEHISVATVEQINIRYELAFQLFMSVKKYFKL